MNTAGEREKFVKKLLPWIAAGTLLLVYLLTMSHWISFSNAGLVSQLAGWTWPQNNLMPVTLLLTFPLRWLPVTGLPLALNFLSVLAATATVFLLARSVALLPHDRTQAQRERERSEFSFLTIPTGWVPPVLAVLVAGLQLTFWENAVVGTSEMIDLLIFAYVVRCLLEFRVDDRTLWLHRAALVYGAGMANNWLMIATVGVKSNRDGIGSSVRIVTPLGHEQFGFVSAAGSYLSAHDKRVHFGLGKERQVKLLEIRWPSGVVQTWKNVAANQIFLAKEAAQ